MVDKISVTILTKDSFLYLNECLSALKDFDEIIILDNGSSDNTIKLAKKFPNVKVFHIVQMIGFFLLTVMRLLIQNWLMR